MAYILRIYINSQRQLPKISTSHPKCQYQLTRQTLTRTPGFKFPKKYSTIPRKSQRSMTTSELCLHCSKTRTHQKRWGKVNQFNDLKKSKSLNLSKDHYEIQFNSIQFNLLEKMSTARCSAGSK